MPNYVGGTGKPDVSKRILRVAKKIDVPRTVGIGPRNSEQFASPGAVAAEVAFKSPTDRDPVAERYPRARRKAETFPRKKRREHFPPAKFASSRKPRTPSPKRDAPRSASKRGSFGRRRPGADDRARLLPGERSNVPPPTESLIHTPRTDRSRLRRPTLFIADVHSLLCTRIYPDPSLTRLSLALEDTRGGENLGKVGRHAGNEVSRSRVGCLI